MPRSADGAWTLPGSAEVARGSPDSELVTQPLRSAMFSYPDRLGQAGAERWGGRRGRTTLSESESNPDKKSMKVTDRRMFTPEGELREEYRHLENAEPPAAGVPTVRESEPPPPPEPEKRAPEPDPDRPGFYDLVSLLAENASVYLRHAGAPGGEGRQNRELARLHIDLLEVLEQKTAGNLDAEEKAMLGDILYRLRLAFASQRGF